MEEYGNRPLSILSSFGIRGQFLSYEEITHGKVNQTTRVDYALEGRKESYVVQRINTYVFHNPSEMMDNIGRITRHIRERGGRTLEFLETKDGKNYVEADDGTSWRVYRLIDASSFTSSSDPLVVENAGRAYGTFLCYLSDFDASSLYYTIPDFHNTPKRYEDLKKAVAADALGRLESSREEVEFVLSKEREACLLSSLQKEGRLPLRVTHNDTKISNVLFDRETKESVAVLDLDTVMPGLTGHDFGDAVRSACNSMGSGSLEFDKVRLDLDVFSSFTRGFLSVVGDTLLPLEKETLPDSVLVMTLELASRYLADYLMGDKYFKARYPEQNLDRARNLIALGKDEIKVMEEMRHIVKTFC